MRPAQPADPHEAFDYSFETDCLRLTKDQSTGDYHLMTIFSNRFRDRDMHAFPEKGGEIISTAAHRKYMAYLDANPDQAPELWSLHIPGTERENRAHWWDFDGDFAYAEFKLTPEEALGVYTFAQQYEPGLSHGFAVYEYDEKEGVIEDYITYEISILPNEWAANPWTTFGLIRKELENMKLTPEKRAALVALHGEGYVAKLESDTGELAKTLGALGVDTKDIFVKEEETPAAEPATTTETPAAPAPAVTEEAIVAALNTLHMALSGEIKGLVARIEKLEAQDTDRVAAKAAAATPSVLASWQPQSVTQAQKNGIYAQDPLYQKEPVQAAANGGHWFNGFLGEGN